MFDREVEIETAVTKTILEPYARATPHIVIEWHEMEATQVAVEPSPATAVAIDVGQDGNLVSGLEISAGDAVAGTVGHASAGSTKDPRCTACARGYGRVHAGAAGPVERGVIRHQRTWTADGVGVRGDPYGVAAPEGADFTLPWVVRKTESPWTVMAQPLLSCTRVVSAPLAIVCVTMPAGTTATTVAPTIAKLLGGEPIPALVRAPFDSGTSGRCASVGECR